MPRNIFTADEIIASLKHTNLPTIVVEGKDDMKIYRLLEKSLKHQIDILQCGGRTTLFQVFERKAEFKNSNVIFIADSDMYVFSEIPARYISDDLRFTKGYSIENDLYMDGQKMLDSAFLDNRDLKKKNDILKSVIEWFAFEVEYYVESEYEAFSNTLKQVKLNSTKCMARGETNFVTDFLTSRDYRPASTAILEDLKKNYATKLRGKFLFQIYQKIFLEQEDKYRVKYSEMQLFYQCFNVGKNEKQKNTNINRFLRWAEKRLISS